MTHPSAPLSPLRLARAPVAAFAAMGICWGSFAADLPDIKAMLAVDEAELGRLLLMTPIAAILAMMAAPWLGQRLGARALPVAALVMAASFALPGQVAVWWLFPLAMLLAGGATGAADVLMNARASTLEAASGRSLMNLCHAAYSFGYAWGAVVTGVLRSGGAPPAVVMGAAAAGALVVALMTLERGARIEGLARPARGSAPLGVVPVIGGLIVLIAYLTENAAEYWSALHIEQTLGGSPAFGSAAPAILALTMGTARLAGQGLSERVPPLRLMLGGSLISACGALGVAAAGTPVQAYAGFVVMGVGSSVIAPTAFTLVGRRAAPEVRARAIARATMLGYGGYFVGPPALGFIAGSAGLPMAFVFAAGLLALVWVLAPLANRV